MKIISDFYLGLVELKGCHAVVHPTLWIQMHLSSKCAPVICSIYLYSLLSKVHLHSFLSSTVNHPTLQLVK